AESIAAQAHGQANNAATSAGATQAGIYDLIESGKGDQAERALVLNIVRNALQALGPEGGEITLRTRTAFQLTLHGERYRLAARI
ncbi:hypothetical protein ONJ95_25860, partial [Salmonella enterica subsp. enterica serovar Virginia]|nr:hypothetical protein [Salmonella enterica subsp. enterica serovar Virginia]